jgi:16S rRNA (guanine527-N7)-methyltransferase
MVKWNAAYNLTAIRDVEQMVIRHVFDSLATLPHITAHHIVDVGTGAGLPGIPLAIATPEKRYVLLDSNGKKTRFLFHVKTQLALTNVDVVHSRVEAYQAPTSVDGVISRAFAELTEMCDYCAHLLPRGGWLYAMKAAQVDRELQTISAPFRYHATVNLKVPELAEHRALVVLRRMQDEESE